MVADGFVVWIATSERAHTPKAAFPANGPAEGTMSTSLDRLFRALLRINELASEPTGSNQSILAIAREIVDACGADGCQLFVDNDPELGSADVMLQGEVREHFALPHPACPVLAGSDPACVNCSLSASCPGVAPPDFGAALCAPLGEQGAVRGVLRVWRARPEPFSRTETDLIVSASAGIGAVLLHRQVLAQLRQAHESLAAAAQARTRELADSSKAALDASKTPEAATSQQPSPRAPLDLKKLADDTGWDFAVTHVSRYLERADEWLSELRAAVDAGQPEEAAKIAHRIRGSAIHMPDITQAATDAMEAGRAHELAALRAAVAPIASAIERTRADFARQLSKYGPRGDR